jgi:hypothetical protein
VKPNEKRLRQLFAGTHRLTEDNVKRAIGSGVLPTSSLSDPHIRKIIDHIHKTSKISVADIEDEISSEVARIAKQHAKSPLLFGSMMANAVEAALFDMFSPKAARTKPEHNLRKRKNNAGEDEIVPKIQAVPKSTVPKWDPVIFSALVRRIKAENQSIFPLRNFYNKKPIISPRIIYVPSKHEVDQKQFGDIDTAAATPKGEFIFNLHFMQQCMDFSHTKGIKPKGKKYVSNGGEFPDEYCMIEFLILHEFFHYTHADFHYHKVLKDDEGKKAVGKIINWVGDFRTNYDLIKAGHEGIPMGLYNELVNYDRQYTYEEMYNLVKNELKKLKEKKVPKVGDLVKDLKGKGYHIVTAVDMVKGEVDARPATQAEIDAVLKPAPAPQIVQVKGGPAPASSAGNP